MFRKYFSIEGSWRTKEIAWWIDQYPELKDEEFVLQEKIHGANMSWIFEPNGTFSIAKRSGILKNEVFYNHDIIYGKYSDLIDMFKEHFNGHSAIVYGEWFGEGIQKGVDYGKGKHIRFFDVVVDDVLLTPEEMEDLFSLLNIEDMLVPVFAKIKGLKNTLDYPIVDKVTQIYPEGGSIIEGVVIKPYNKVYFENGNNNSTKLGRVFYIKNKNEKFKEIQREKRPQKESLPGNVLKLKLLFEEYINENRVDSVFSHYGEIQSDKQLGDYIKYILEDAKQDFTKDHNDYIISLSKSELKQVFNVSKIIVPLLKDRL